MGGLSGVWELKFSRTNCANRGLAGAAAAGVASILLLASAAYTQTPLENGGRSKIQLSPCGSSGELAAARCGTLDVFENRAAGSGRKIPIQVVVVPAKSDKPARDPVFFLPGGPGTGAADSFLSSGGAGMANLLGGFRAQRDIVFVDYRGTGRSHPLPCPIYPPSPTVNDYLTDPVSYLPAKTVACREQLEKDADLAQYNTPNIVDDLDDVRMALGYTQINLYGMSYGTRVGMVYLRRHPEGLRAVILEAVDPPFSRLPLYVARAAQQVIDRTIADCAADSACRGAYPNLNAEFDAVLARLEKAPAKFQFADAKGVMVSVELSRRMFMDRMLEMIYTPGASRMLPYIIHRASMDDFSAYASAIERLFSGSEDGMSRGMYLSVMCGEDVDWITEQDAAREASGTLIGSSLVDAEFAACKSWPRSRILEDYAQPVTSSVPVLLLSGELDPVTPAWMAKEAAKHLRNALLSVNPAGGHGTKSRTCQIPMMEKFIEQGSAKGLDVSCVADSRRPPFITDSSSAAQLLGRATGSN